MAELTPRYTWVLELSTEELVLIHDALTETMQPQYRSRAAKLASDLLRLRARHEKKR